MFDCENREESFCRVSQYPWRPGGLKSCPVPPLSLVDWTDVAQTAWYEFMEERPDYKPPYEPLPYTISFHGRRFFKPWPRPPSLEDYSDDGSDHDPINEPIVGRGLSLGKTRAGKRINQIPESQPEKRIKKPPTGFKAVKVKGLEMDLWPEEDYFQDYNGDWCRFVKHGGCVSC